MEQPTVLFDEVDTVFGRSSGPAAQEIRAILNAGHRRGQTIPRCVGEGSDLKVEDFNVFAAVALSALGELPETITDRSVIIRMRKRAPNEKVEPFRARDIEAEACVLRRRLGAWTKRHRDSLTSARPENAHCTGRSTSRRLGTPDCSVRRCWVRVARKDPKGGGCDGEDQPWRSGLARRPSSRRHPSNL